MNTTNGSNKLAADDRAGHDWYRFVLSFPPHLVRDYLDRFAMRAGHQVMDPFCGTGTTLVECKKLGIASIGMEANPMAHFATQVKTDWRPDPGDLIRHASMIAESALGELAASGMTDEALPLFQEAGQEEKPDLKALPPDAAKLLLADSISPRPLHKVLVLLEHIERSRDERYDRHERLALAKALVFSISNLTFGPEVGVGAIKPDASVIGAWLDGVYAMATDLRVLTELGDAPATAYHADARRMVQDLAPRSVDAVITSPPYPNEKDYTRTTRLETVMLGFIHNRADLQALKRGLIRSNTRNVYRDDDDDRWITAFPEIQRIADAIEARRIELGKTSGFERMYARVTKLYFGGMARHLADLRRVLRTRRAVGLRGRRSGLLSACHDPHRPDSGRHRGITGVRACRHRSVPHAPGDCDQGAAQGRGRCPAMAR